MELPKRRAFILDGGTGTFLQSVGYDGKGCAEDFILSHRDSVLNLQKKYVESGSEVLLTPTFSANPFSLFGFGKADDCEELNARLCEITVEAGGGKAKIAGNIGPTNVSVEPFGEMRFYELVSAYRRQVKALNDYVDFFYAETMTSLSDMRAALLACKETGKPVFITISVDEDGCTLNDGVSAQAALITLEAMGADAFGINCLPFEYTLETLEELLSLAKIPLIAKPSAYIPDTQSILTPDQSMPYFEKLLEMGIPVIGGCCGTTPDHIAVLKEVCGKISFPAEKEPTEDISLVLANSAQAFYLEPETTEASEPVRCCSDMCAQIDEICAGTYDIMAVQIDTTDDAIDFALNAPLATLPVMFCSDTEDALDRALMLYQGRAMIDQRSLIDEEKLAVIAKKYGAVIY